MNFKLLTSGTKQVRIWSNRDPYDNHTVPRTNTHPKRVFELILGLMQPPQWHQQPPRKTPNQKPSSNTTVSVAWIIEPVTDSQSSQKVIFNQFFQCLFTNLLTANFHSAPPTTQLCYCAAHYYNGYTVNLEKCKSQRSQITHCEIISHNGIQNCFFISTYCLFEGFFKSP